MGDLLRLSQVTRRFDEHIVLYNVSLSVKEKEIFGIIGRSGCGKTTLLRVLIGFLSTSSGSVHYKGKALTKVRAQVERQIGFAAQKSSVYDKLTVQENLVHYGRMYGLTRKEIVERSHQLLELFGLFSAQQVLAGSLSSGMLKRLDMACALIHDPEVLILDEPTADLDPLLRQEILHLIRKINEYGTTVIITSHILNEIDLLCDRIAILDNSRILKIGNPQKMEDAFFAEKVVKLQTGKARYEELVVALEKKGAPVSDYYLEGDSLLCLHTTDPQDVLALALAAVEGQGDVVRVASIVKPNLEDLFAQLVEKKK